MKYYYFFISIFFLIFPNYLLSCTGIRFKTAPGSVIYARTFDETRNFHEAILFVPRNYFSTNYFFTENERRSFDLLSMDLNAQEPIVLPIGDLGGLSTSLLSFFEIVLPSIVVGASLSLSAYYCIKSCLKSK